MPGYRSVRREARVNEVRDPHVKERDGVRFSFSRKRLQLPFTSAPSRESPRRQLPPENIGIRLQYRGSDVSRTRWRPSCIGVIDSPHARGRSAVTRRYDMRSHVTSVCASCLLAIASLSSHGLDAADVWFRLEASAAAPGTTVRVPFTIESDAEVRAFATVVNFDESLLQVTDIETVYVVPDIYNRNPTYPTEYEASVNWAFHAVHYGNTDDEPGDGTNEGVIKAAGLWSFTEYVALPTGRPNEIFSFDFRVNDDAEEGTTEIRFEDYLVLPGTSSNARNVVTIS